VAFGISLAMKNEDLLKYTRDAAVIAVNPANVYFINALYLMVVTFMQLAIALS